MENLIIDKSVASCMAPTNGLRFVIRKEQVGDDVVRTWKILQQAWQDVYIGTIEWIDVPQINEE